MKPPVRRPVRVGELIREQIGALMPELRDPRIGLTTVTEVKMSPDLKHGRVYVSILGGAEERAKTLVGLNSAASHIRHEIGARLRLRNTPKLIFFYDASVEYGARIEELIVKTKQAPESD